MYKRQAPSSPGSETTAPSTTAKPDKNVLFGVDYDADSDAFYDKKEHYITLSLIHISA